MLCAFGRGSSLTDVDVSGYSEHACFVDAIKAGLLLHEQNPDFKIRVCELSEYRSEEVASEVAA